MISLFNKDNRNRRKQKKKMKKTNKIKQGTNVESGTLVNNAVFFEMPKRKGFSNKRLINIYEREYFKQLRTEHIISTKEIELDQHYAEMSRYIDLLLKIRMRDFTNDERSLIDFMKLFFYKEKIAFLKEKTDARLIALNELYRIFKFSKIRVRDIILQEINQLITASIITGSQLIAIEKEIEGYRSTRINNLNIDEKKLIAAYNELLKITNGIVENEESVDDLLATKIARLEVAAEEYVFSHQDKFIEMDFELDEIDRDDDKSKNKENHLSRLEAMRQRFFLFVHFGDRSLKEERENKFYRIKFDVVTSDNNYNFSVEDVEHFEKVFAGKIQAIINGTNPNLEEMFGSDISRAKRLFLSTITVKNKKIDYDIFWIEFVAFVNAFDSTKKLDKFFRYYLVQPAYDFSDKLISFAQKVSWEAISDFSSFSIKSGVAALCQLRRKHIQNPNVYYLPEGIKTIDSWYKSWKVNILDTARSKISALKEKMTGKIVILPNSLRILFISTLMELECVPLAIVLNDNDIFSLYIAYDKLEFLRHYPKYHINNITILPASYRDSDLDSVYEQLLSGAHLGMSLEEVLDAQIEHGKQKAAEKGNRY